MTLRAVVRGVGHYLPDRIMTNADFEASLDTSDDWIRSRSGIERRHIAGPGETTSVLATRAAERALASAGLTGTDIDAIILATSTADLTFPSAATMVQHAIGMKGGFAFDIQAVCAGFVYALTNANALILAGAAERVLVIGAETFSRLIDWTDRSTCVLFGDGAGAVVLEGQTGAGSAADRGILATDLHSDGAYRELLYVDGGVSTGQIGHLRMQGKEVLEVALVVIFVRELEDRLAEFGREGDDGLADERGRPCDGAEHPRRARAGEFGRGGLIEHELNAGVFLQKRRGDRRHDRAFDGLCDD